MGVYIRCMEMPKNCRKCPLLYVCDGSKDCPLVEVPPHGRLIDADEYKQVMKDCRMAFWDEVLDSMPTIIPAEEGE